MTLLALALGCTGCSPHEVGSQDEIRSTLRAYEAGNCDIETVVEHHGLYGTSSLMALRHWLYDALLQSRQIQVVWQRHDEFRSMGEISYRQKSTTFYVWWNDYHPPAIPVRQRIELRACLFAPRRIDLMDSRIDNNTDTAEVRYMPYRGFSWIGWQLHRLNLLAGNNAFEPMNGYAETAVLKYDPSGKWHVEYASG